MKGCGNVWFDQTLVDPNPEFNKATLTTSNKHSLLDKIVEAIAGVESHRS